MRPIYVHLCMISGVTQHKLYLLHVLKMCCFVCLFFYCQLHLSCKSNTEAAEKWEKCDGFVSFPGTDCCIRLCDYWGKKILELTTNCSPGAERRGQFESLWGVSAHRWFSQQQRYQCTLKWLEMSDEQQVQEKLRIFDSLPNTVVCFLSSTYCCALNYEVK